ncbi:MAG: 1-acyl-sn-glycerol-3-phosphate acyltransferase [Methylacidiphilales bacterium]|nr:1-acyl-sn-glycerol-3-phosphate acyltransferase [Candidatus Methylacidiphilales bacterium]
MSTYSEMGRFYRFAYNIVGIELFFHRIRIEGRENVPTGGCLIVSNHVSFMDPTTVGWAVAREIYYLGRKSLFKPPFWNLFLPLCNVLPIDRDGHDITGLRRIIRMLKEGHAVLLFPEGTRSTDGKLQPAEPGAGLIAMKAGVPILPVRVFGTFESLSRHTKRLRFHPIRVVIGQPYQPAIPEGHREKESYGLVAQEMLDRIAALR